MDDALEKAFKSLNKKFGKMSPVGMMKDLAVPLRRVSSGSLSIDYVCGDKKTFGIPLGRTITFFGPSSGGKTTVGLGVVAQFQKDIPDRLPAIVDVEGTITEEYCQSLGIDTERLIFAKPETAEAAAEITKELVLSHQVSIVMIDSLTAMAPADSMEKSFIDNEKMASQASLITRFLRDMTPLLGESDTTLLCISQTRANMDRANPYSPKEKMAGSYAQSFYSSIILKVSKKESVKVGDELVGNKVVVTVTKNKVGSPGRSCTLFIKFGEGISREDEIIDLGERYGVISRSGAYYSFNNERIANGKANLRSLLENNPDLFNKIRALVVEASQVKNPETVNLQERDQEEPSEE